MTTASFFAIRDCDGHWFVAKGKRWASKVWDAHVFANANAARGMLSRIVGAHPDRTPPEIVEFFANEAGVLDERKRVAAAIKRASAGKSPRKPYIP